MSKGCGCCANSSISKRDFDMNGDVPEVMPHKKAGRKKGRGTKRTDHKHIYETNGWVQHRYGYSKNPAFYYVKRYECLECGKAGKTQYLWNRTPDGNFQVELKEFDWY